MAKSEKKPSDKEISMDLDNKAGLPPALNTGSPKSKAASNKGKVVAAPKSDGIKAQTKADAESAAKMEAAKAAPGPKDSSDIKSSRQEEAAKLVQNLRTQKSPVIMETGNPILDPAALKEGRDEKPLTSTPTPPSPEGEWVIMPNYMSFSYGSVRYTFERGRPTLVPREVYKSLKADGLI